MSHSVHLYLLGSGVGGAALGLIGLGCCLRLEILAFFMLTGVFSTLLIKETNQKTLEDISSERQDRFVTGESSTVETIVSQYPVHDR